ncbi:hypothetical protein IEQ34_009460 [Dendrobium chrysotoxum]|uniref:Uncharacterized protein n=1 Tax=Dendrobium chrysotoxum TaxID=161865 RepID=A0AAV7H2X9_DENCH|nr:hypothetical protein IEQ34_009460 [Dendrobium chrysotoxum]
MKHFSHLNKNRLSGQIPENLFSSNMRLLHLLLDRKKLDGMILASIGTVQTLEIICIDKNFLGGLVSSSINNLTSLHVFDLSNNSFYPSEAPIWISEIENVTTLAIESSRLHGQVPQKLFSFPRLQQVKLSNNSLNGTVDMGSSISEQLQAVATIAGGSTMVVGNNGRR